jgi:hypothetical protein
VAVYVNFAMHLDTVGGTEASADYPASMAELLRRSLNEDLTTLFTIGAAGDINHRDVRWADRQKGIREATRIGTHIASAALSAVRQGSTSSTPTSSSRRSPGRASCGGFRRSLARITRS